MRKYVRYLEIPAALLGIASIPILLIRPNPHGIVFGGLMFTLGIVFWTIGEASRAPRQAA